MEVFCESSAIRALGPLFKITEVFLWDDGLEAFLDAHVGGDGLEEEPTISSSAAIVSCTIKVPVEAEFSAVEDVELSQQMEALGLPTSFTTREVKTAPGARKKGPRIKSLSASRDAGKKIPVPSGFGEHEDFTSSGNLYDKMNICSCFEGKKECSQLNGNDEHDRGCSPSDEESCTTGTSFNKVQTKTVCDEATNSIIGSSEGQSTVNMNELDSLKRQLSFIAEEYTENVLEDARPGHHHEGRMSSQQDDDRYSEVSSLSCHSSSVKNDSPDIRTSEPFFCSLSQAAIEHRDHHDLNNSTYHTFGEWIVAWDAFYRRYYYYNRLTLESTWYPPADLENLAISCTKCSPSMGIEFPCGNILQHDEHGLQDRVDLCQEERKDVDVFNQSQSEVPLNTSATRLGFDEAVTKNECEIVLKDDEVKQNSDEQVTLHFSYDENDNLSERRNVCEVSGEDPIDCSLTTELSDLGLEENCKRSAPDKDISLNDELEVHCEIVTMKKKKRIRRPPRLSLEGETGGLSANIVKYWHQRYLLFSRFDNGIKMDEEGWFSVTPESIARHHASRCASGVVIDCFTGVGGNAIQFASKSNHVIAVDIDPQKIDYARNNAALYGVSEKIDFIIADFFQIAPSLKGDTLFLSPPWGGPDYTKVHTYDIQRMLKPCDGFYLFTIARMIASKVVMFLPRNVDLNQLAELSLSATPPWSLEVEKNILNGKLKAITAYFVNTKT